MPTETKRRGVLRWRGVVKMGGKIVASKWFGAGPKEHRQAILWEETTRKAIAQQTIRTDSVTPLEWAEAHLDDVQRRCSKKTYLEKRSALLRLLRFAGDRPLTNFNPAFALSFLQIQYDQRSGYASNKDRKNLSTAWEWGRKFLDGFPNAGNPFLAVPRFKEARKTRYVPPEEDFAKVLSVCSGQDLVMMKTFEHLGARKGELFRLLWSDVDFRAGVVWLVTAKTSDGSERRDYVSMSHELKSILMGWWQERRSDYVFTCTEASPRHAGQPFKYRQHFMRRICALAGVKPFDFHSIRHLSAVRLYKAGHPVSLIQKFLRHRNPSTTERYLANLGYSTGQMQEAVEVFSRGKAKVIPMPEKERAL